MASAFDDPVASMAAERLRDKIRKNTPVGLDVFKDAAANRGDESDSPPPGDEVLLQGETPGAPPLDILQVPSPPPPQASLTEESLPLPKRRGRPPKLVKEPKGKIQNAHVNKLVETQQAVLKLKRELPEPGVRITLPLIDSVIPEHAEQALEKAYQKLEVYAKQIQAKRNEGHALFCYTCKTEIADHSRAMMRMCLTEPVTRLVTEYLWCSENCYVLARANHRELFETRDTTGAHLSDRGR